MNPWLAEVPWIDRDDADIDAYVARLKHRPDYDLAARLTEWRDNGFVILEQAARRSEIDALLEDIDCFRQHYGSYRIPIEIRQQQLESDEAESFPLDEFGVKINQIHCFSRAAALLSLTPRVVDFLRHVFAAPAAVTQSLTFWRGSQQPVHIDYPYVCQQKRLAFLAAAWVPLEDVHPHAGPLGYYPGGHKVGNSGFFDWGGGDILYRSETATRTPMQFAHYLWARMEECGLKRADFCPKKGDVLIWHGNLPHEGTRIIDPALTRKSYVTHYTSLPDLPDWMRPRWARVLRRGVFRAGATAYEHPWLAGRPKLPSW